MHNILFTGSTLTEEKIEALKKQGLAIFPERIDLTEEELVKALEDKEGYILGGEETATKKIIDSAKHLKIISFMGSGYQKYIDVKAAKAKNIIVTYTPAANAYSVAEHTAALILDANKHITDLNNKLKKGTWERFQSWDLKGKTLGIIGMGAVGQHLAKIMHQGFGMNIIYCSLSEKEVIEKQFSAKKVSKSQLLTQSDIVSIHTSHTSKTENMIGKKELTLMKPSAMLINTARAIFVNGHDLYEALNKNQISMAAFDGYYVEPAPQPEQDEYKLLSLPDDKFLINPHNAFNSKDAVEAMERMDLESMLDFFTGETVRHQVTE